MQFSDIKFDERNGSGAFGLGLTIRGVWVYKSTFELAWRQSNAVWPTLDPQGEYDAEILNDAELWPDYRIGKRLALGRCIKYFVDHGMLPLYISNSGKKGKRKYRLKN
jgi:hypothetical protein